MDPNQNFEILPPFTVRLASLEDITDLQKLIQESVRVLSAPYYSSPQIHSALTYIFGVDTQLILDGTYFVAEMEGLIIGCGGWSQRTALFGGDQRKLDQDGTLLEPAKDPARIRAFYVHPKWSRKGIARKIIQYCEAAAGNAGFKKMELVATLPGEPLYKAMGYEVIEPVELSTPDGQSLGALRMGKNLESVLFTRRNLSLGTTTPRKRP